MSTPTPTDPAALAGIEVSPAPWHLVGRGAILWLCPQRSPGVRGLRTPGALAFVDYAQSGVDPYLELLHVPRFTHSGGTIGPTIDRIWVTSKRSVVSGRANWGIPKDLAAITRSPVGDGGGERWVAAVGGAPLASLSLTPKGPQIPIAKPRGVGRLLQRMHGELYRTPISVAGRLRVATVDELVLGDVFRDLRPSQVKLAVLIEHFTMGFHEPDIG